MRYCGPLNANTGDLVNTREENRVSRRTPRGGLARGIDVSATLDQSRRQLMVVLPVTHEDGWVCPHAVSSKRNGEQ